MKGDLVQLEPWLDKDGICEFMGCKRRYLEYRMAEGLPRAMIAGKVKFRASEVQDWMREHGYWERIA